MQQASPMFMRAPKATPQVLPWSRYSILHTFCRHGFGGKDCSSRCSLWALRIGSQEDQHVSAAAAPTSIQWRCQRFHVQNERIFCSDPTPLCWKHVTGEGRRSRSTLFLSVSRFHFSMAFCCENSTQPLHCPMSTTFASDGICETRATPS
jgi:hypothetical protein